MKDHFFAVIMAGGGGTRLWPLSRRARPKQMLKLFGDRTMFQIAVQRLSGLFPPDRILVVTVAEQAEGLKSECPEIPGENFIIEPYPRGTASAIGLAAVTLVERDPQAVMAVLTSDHFIEDEAHFRTVLSAAAEVAQQEYMVTLGIAPTFPSTGYGYIQSGALLGTFQGVEAKIVLRFKEKPDEVTARAFIEAGDHAWNSGMFIWKTSQLMKEFSRQMPELATGLETIASALNTKQAEQTLEKVWQDLTPATIDYGIMEGAERVAVLAGESLGWSDVGSWDSLYEVIPADRSGNIIINADHLARDTRDTLLLDDAGRRLVVLLGVKDLVVIETEDVLLICHKGNSQEIRQIVDELKSSGRQDLT